MATKKKFSSGTSGGNMLPWLGVAAIVILIDQLTKITIAKLFAYGEAMAVTSFFNLVLVYNKGAAFSFLASETGWQRHVLTAVGIGAALFILYLLKRHAGQRMFCWALALILGGALGKIRAGDLRYVAAPDLESYHSVWFELHQDLIGLLGTTRAREAAAGRAV